MNLVFFNLNNLKEDEFNFLRARKLKNHGVFIFCKLQNPRKEDLNVWQAKTYFNIL